MKNRDRLIACAAAGTVVVAVAAVLPSAPRRFRAWRIDRLERLRDLPDPAERTTYWDLAEALLDDGLADVVEELGWTL